MKIIYGATTGLTISETKVVTVSNGQHLCYFYATGSRAWIHGNEWTASISPIVKSQAEQYRVLVQLPSLDRVCIVWWGNISCEIGKQFYFIDLC